MATGWLAIHKNDIMAVIILKYPIKLGMYKKISWTETFCLVVDSKLVFVGERSDDLADGMVMVMVMVGTKIEGKVME